MQLFNEVSDLVTVVISVVAFVFSILTYYRSEIVEKKKNTVSAYIELQETLHCLYEYQKDEIEDFVNDKHSSEYKCLSSCVARLEIFAAGVKNQLYDFDLLYEMSNGFLDVDIRRKVQQIMDKKTKNCWEYYYSNLKWLYENMDKKSRKSRKKFKLVAFFKENTTNRESMR